MNRKRLLALATVGLVLSVAAGAAFVQLQNPAADMTAAAGKFLASLDDEQRATVLHPYDTPQRVGWHFIPMDHRKGLQIKHMSEPQRKAAHDLLKASLSQAGYQKTTTIMALEHVLYELQKGRQGPIRDAERYYLTMFGEPRDGARWGLSFEGHHLSLNFVIDGDQVVSSTPSFMAANPTVVQHEVKGGPPKGTRVLAKEEDLAFELVRSLSAEQLKTALIDEKAPAEIRAAGDPQPPATPAAGIAAKSLTAEQQKVLRALIDAYAGNMPAVVAHGRWEAIEAAGFDSVHFAWAGAREPGIGHYYRIQGPTFLIELVNTQPDGAGNPASHIHSVWRDMRGDFAIAVAAN